VGMCNSAGVTRSLFGGSKSYFTLSRVVTMRIRRSAEILFYIPSSTVASTPVD
jgi:hypothetical protein